MTFAQLKQACSQLGMTITYRAQWNEYRVNFKDGSEATAYYTDEKSDAYETARDMAARRACMLAIAS